jgi:GNAT superfamily N-acetyltransferase
MHFRPAAMADKPALEALQMRASLQWDAYRAALQAHPDAVEVPAHQIRQGQVLIACRGSRILGFVALDFVDDDAEVDGLFVEPDCWGSGIGRSLLGEAGAIAVERGCAAMRVIANPEAAAFYEKCGFAERAEVATRFGPAVRMVKPLP